MFVVSIAAYLTIFLFSLLSCPAAAITKSVRPDPRVHGLCENHCAWAKTLPCQLALRSYKTPSPALYHSVKIISVIEIHVIQHFSLEASDLLEE